MVTALGALIAAFVAAIGSFFSGSEGDRATTASYVSLVSAIVGLILGVVAPAWAWKRPQRDVGWLAAAAALWSLLIIAFWVYIVVDTGGL
jgi:hypothetical protein